MEKDPATDYMASLLKILKSIAHFTSIKVMHVRRDANKAAHVLAKCAISQLLDRVWIQECPSYITDVVLADNAGTF
jgi:hypothetical protein